MEQSSSFIFCFSQMNSFRYQCIIDIGKLQFILWNQPAPFGAAAQKSEGPTPFGIGRPLLFQGLFQRPTCLTLCWGPGPAGVPLYLAAAVVAAVAVIVAAAVVAAAEPAAADDPDDEKNNNPGAAIAAESAAAA
jgi:hypothetical protein